MHAVAIEYGCSGGVRAKNNDVDARAAVDDSTTRLTFEPIRVGAAQDAIE